MTLVRKSLWQLVLMTLFGAGVIGLLQLGQGGSVQDLNMQTLLTLVACTILAAVLLCHVQVASTQWRPVGWLGGIVAVAVFAFAVSTVWVISATPEAIAALVVGSIIAFTLAQISLLLGVGTSRALWRRVTLFLTVGLTIIVATLAILGLLVEPPSAALHWQVWSAFAVADALGTVILLACGIAEGRGAAVPILDSQLEQRIRKTAAQRSIAPSQLVQDALSRYLATPPHSTAQTALLAPNLDPTEAALGNTKSGRAGKEKRSTRKAETRTKLPAPPATVSSPPSGSGPSPRSSTSRAGGGESTANSPVSSSSTAMASATETIDRPADEQFSDEDTQSFSKEQLGNW